MEFKELAQQLELIINEKMTEFSKLGKQSKDKSSQATILQQEAEAINLKMAFILKDLEPVEALVRAQNPKMNELFDALKKTYLTTTNDDAATDDIIEQCSPKITL